MAASSMLFVTAHAESTVNVLPVALKTDTLTVEGQLDSKKQDDIMIIVAKPGVEPTKLTDAEDSLVQHLEKKSNEDGSYRISFKLRTDKGDKSGDYSLYIKLGDEKPITKTFYFAITADRDECIGNIDTLSQTELTEQMDDYVKKFGLNEFDAISGAAASDMAAALKNCGTISEGDYEKVQTTIKESAVLSSIKNGATQYIFSSDGNFISDEAVGFADFDKSTGTTLYSVFKNILNENGRQTVINSLSKNTYADYDELKKAFAKAVMLYSVTNTDILGTDYLSDILTKANADYTGMDIGTYLASSQKTRIHTELLKNTSFADLNDLQKKLADIVLNLPEEGSGTGGNNGTGGSSGSTGGGLLGPNASSVTSSAGQTVTDFTFSDVSSNHWAKAAISVLVDKNIISGYPDNTFKTNENLTREQAIKIICEAFEVTSADSEQNFSDVAAGAWYEKYVINGVGAGIINGVGDGAFGVGAKITREDFAVMIYRALSDAKEQNSASFADSAEISEYALEAVAYFKAHGIINGYEDNTFRPKNYITRAEAAMIIYNCLQNR